MRTDYFIRKISTIDEKLTQQFKDEAIYLLGKYLTDRNISRHELEKEALSNILSISRRLTNTSFILMGSDDKAYALILIYESSWDTERLGMKTDKMIILSKIDDPYTLTMFITKTLNKHRSAKPRLIITRVPLNYISIIQALELSGGIITDILVTYRLELNNLNLNKDKGIHNTFKCWNTRNKDKITFKYAETLSEVKEAARIASDAFRYSHYMQDPFIPKEKASRIYSDWVLEAFNNKNKDVILALHQDRIVGFIICGKASITSRYNHGVIDLIAVDKGYRGKGIGTMLVKECINVCKEKKLKTVYVGTQLSNARAVRFYERMGFKLVFAEATLHIHI